MSDLIRVQIFLESGQLISEENQANICKMRNPEILNGLWKAHQNPDNIKRQMSFVKDVCLKDIMHLEVLSPYDDESSLLDSSEDLTVNKS